VQVGLQLGHVGTGDSHGTESSGKDHSAEQ
jgi:hypothetical protein